VTADVVFEPLRFRNLTVKNRILRANISGRFDHYDGSGTPTRISWELRFARGGVGAILSSWVGVDVRGRIVPGYAMIERDDRIPFWRELGKRVHEHDCKYIVQLAHAGRQRDIPGFEIPKALSSTRKPDPLHGFETDRATRAELAGVASAFAAGARRATWSLTEPKTTRRIGPFPRDPTTTRSALAWCPASKIMVAAPPVSIRELVWKPAFCSIRVAFAAYPAARSRSRFSIRG
jgi:hypothetical protein